MVDEAENGSIRTFGDKQCVYYDGYWIRYYAPPAESLGAKKRLIDQLTRCLFHHTEIGINTPGERLEIAREAYEREQDPARRRVNGAMVAGALFNRATDIFTTVVELAEQGVELSADNELMKQCAAHFMEALELGKTVRHYSGHDGIDELWGEPLKAFTMSIAEFYESRYRKIAQTMRDIDRIVDTLAAILEADEVFRGAGALIRDFASAAKHETEIMRADPAIFAVWPEFVASGERLLAFQPRESAGGGESMRRRVAEGRELIRSGKSLLTFLAGARVPMPKSTRKFLDHCQLYRERQQREARKSA